MELAEKLAMLTTHCDRLRSSCAPKPPWIVVQRKQRLVRLFTYRKFIGKLLVVSALGCWRVMICECRTSRDVFLGADFRQPDATRDGAWKYTTSTSWYPVWPEPEEAATYRQAEMLIDLALEQLPAKQS